MATIPSATAAAIGEAADSRLRQARSRYDVSPSTEARLLASGKLSLFVLEFSIDI